MKFYSFVRKGIDLEEIEIEVSLVPGLPAIVITGLPDASIKESVVRIKSALRHQGFLLPTKEQVLIHLRPSFERKSSQGLELAIAAAYLIKTEQVRLTNHYSGKIYFYGELSLDGQVTVPNDIELLEDLSELNVLITGQSESSPTVPYGEIENLKGLNEVKWREPIFNETSDVYSPEVGDATKSSSEFFDRTHDYRSLHYFRFTKAMAEVLAVAGAGEHSIFVAGPAGTGKTTFARALHQALRSPTQGEKRKIDKISRVLKRETFGRPLVSPHHRSTDIALLGGGIPPQPGEITRAQHGLLVMDEFLEFDNYVRESLREPIEERQITVSRSGHKVTYPADFILVATSNLCPCGDYVPGQQTNCGYSVTRCKSYYQRMSGPLLDRFEVVTFSHVWKKGWESEKVELATVKESVLKAQKFASTTRGQSKMNSRLTLKECESTVDSFTLKHLLPEMAGSHRRMLALLRVARTIADLSESTEVKACHIEKARLLTIQPFHELKKAWQ